MREDFFYQDYKQKEPLSGFGLVAIVTALVLIVTIVRGIVLLTLWKWFVVGTFDVPELSLPAAIGISILVSVLTNNGVDTNKYLHLNPFVILYRIVAAFGGLLLCLVGGYIVLQFM